MGKTFKCFICCNVEDSQHAIRVSNSNVVCLHCYANHFYTCDVCRQVRSYDDGWPLNTVYNTRICLSCFEDRFFICEDCNRVFHVDEMDGENLCWQCGKPTINARRATEVEIEDILKFLIEKPPFIRQAKFCSYNRNDDFLKEIVNRVGKVPRPIYIYGLKDRKEYELAISRPLQKRVEHLIEYWDETPYISVWGGMVPVIFTNRSYPALGVSKNLRKNNRDWVCEFITQITS